MKRLQNHLFSFILSLFVIISCTMPTSFATDLELDSPESIRAYLAASDTAVTANEYDILLAQKARALQQMNDSDDMNEIDSELSAILDFDPVSYYYELKSKGEYWLKNAGYEGKQLEAILSFDGTESSIYRASASVTSDLLILDRGKTADGKSYFEAKYIYSWSGVPSYAGTDLLAITSEYFYYTAGSGSSKSYYSTTASSSSNIAKSHDVVRMTKCNGHGAGVDLSMTLNSSGTIYHAFTGHMTATFNSRDYTQTGVAGTYGHSTASINYSIALSVGFKSVTPTLQLDFSQKVLEMAFDELTVDIP